MNENNSITSIPCGEIGALCKRGVEESPQHFACLQDHNSIQKEEALALLHQLWKDGHVSLHGYWCLSALLDL